MRASALRSVAVAAVLLLAGAGVAACGSDQDPGLTPATDSGPTTTSHLVQACPPGGPDSTTPEVGCLDKDGKLVH